MEEAGDCPIGVAQMGVKKVTLMWVLCLWS